MPRMGEDLRRYLREEMMPNVWCPGCGHGNVLRGIATALDRVHADLQRVVTTGESAQKAMLDWAQNAQAKSEPSHTG